MHSLDLYALVEEHLGFEEEIKTLYSNIKELVLETKPAALIDIGCGQGEFCKAVQEEGIKVLGVDLSQKQIDAAQKKGVDAQCIDIKDINQKYDCATAVFDVINYLPRNYIKEFLAHTYNLLNENGYFIFDINSFFGFEDIAQGSLNIDTEKKFIAIDAHFEDDTLYTDITLFTKTDDLYKKDTGTIEQYFYDNNFLKQALEDSGFEVVKIVDFNLHSEDECDKFIFVCKKI
ncbi:MAG: class I SAM-dependent methyltransferase [Campylobacterota bacterium]|nr:class I SAM-dependent methyltransferase [Campylobacterota bacterium]